MKAALTILVLVGCDKATPPSPPPPAAAVPLALRFGRCAPIATTFVSGVDHSPPPGYDTSTYALKGHEAALAACFTRDAGVAVIELGVAPKIYGIADPIAQACALAVAKTLPTTPLRCPIAFGKRPLTHVFDFVPDGITLDGARVPLDVLARKAPAIDPNAVLSVVDGPIVIRPNDAAPMKWILPVLDKIYVSQDDFVLVARGDRPLDPAFVLPLVPAPAGQPVEWNHLLRPRDPTVDEERVALSVAVTRKSVWIGMSRLNDFQDIPNDASRAARFAAALAKWKHTAYFENRTDLEIGADDDVTFGDVVAAVDAAEAVGFVDWQVGPTKRLTAKPSR